MDSATLHDKIEQAAKSGKPKMYFDLLGTESLRCWLNVYMPGEGTAGLHYHHSDETFTVIEGSGEIAHRDGKRTKIEEGSVVLIPAKPTTTSKTLATRFLRCSATGRKPSAAPPYIWIQI
jgi:quercetin dioxygenase-like cupin family protein